MAFSVLFDTDRHILDSRVTGQLSAGQVADWSSALCRSSASLATTDEFRVLNDLVGYEVSEQEVSTHKQMREIMPRFLAEHGFVVGFWHLYDAVPPAPSRSGRCTRVAHVHHDSHKMDRYNELLGSPVERFFCDRDAALTWLSET